MNNGLTGEGRARKRIRDEVYGKPQGAAKLILARVNRSAWEYRGIRFTGRKLGGWNGGSEWAARESPLPIASRRSW